MFVTILPAFAAFAAFACADTADMSGQNDADVTDTNEVSENAAQRTNVANAPLFAQKIAAPQNPAGWPADCEEFYFLRAHGAATAGDVTPYTVRGGADEDIEFYFDVPWQGDRQLLMARTIIDNRPIVHHWALYTIQNLKGSDGSIYSARNFLHKLELKDAQFVLGGGAGPDDVRLPDDVGFRLPSQEKSNIGLLLEFHYFSAEEGALTDDTSGVELCVTSKPRAHEAAPHRLGREEFELPPHQATDVAGTCEPLQHAEPVHIVAVGPHMHSRGTHAKLVLNRTSGEELVLHDQPYDSREQRAYWMNESNGEREVILNPGDTLETTCSYDNPHDTTVLSGALQENEMCIMFAWAWPAGLLTNGIDFGAELAPTHNIDCLE